MHASHQITFLPGGRTVRATGDESVLDAALRQGLALPYGCRDGACRSCAAVLREGAIEYPRGSAAEAGGAPGSPVVLLCQARARGDLTVEVERLGSAPIPPARTVLARVAARSELAHDVVGLELELRQGERFEFVAGQYVDVVLRDGRRRAFSIANGPRADGRLELQIRCIPDGRFSRFVAEGLRPRAVLRVHGPLGNFHLRRDHAGPAVLVAGGTGFAPLKAIVEASLAAGRTAPLHLYCGVRAERDLYMDALARGWSEAHAHIAYTPVLSEPEPADGWNGRTGLVHRAALDDHASLAGHAAYLSGPPAMVDAAREAFVDRGIDPSRVYSDAFDYAHETGHDRTSPPL